MKTIGIDCRLSGARHAGIGRYVEELVRQLIRTPDIHWVLFVEDLEQLSWVNEQENISIRVVPISHYTLREQLSLPAIFAREHLDLLHVPHFNVPLLYRGKVVVTIHDLLWHQQRGSDVTTLSPLKYALKYQAYRLVTSQAIQRAQSILVPAETVKQTILTFHPHLNPHKIKVTHEGVDSAWHEIMRAKLQAHPKILFYTGSLYPHKNVSLVVQALRQLPDYQLCISSARNVFVTDFLAQVKTLGLDERVVHLGHLSDSELRQWYVKSTALVQPSLSEGFGLTGIEAMAAGLPVLASDIPIFREIFRDACIRFDPQAVDSFVVAVHHLETLDRPTLIKRGQQLARAYSWERMAAQTLAVYRQLL